MGALSVDRSIYGVTGRCAHAVVFRAKTLGNPRDRQDGPSGKIKGSHAAIELLVWASKQEAVAGAVYVAGVVAAGSRYFAGRSETG
jgi:hypothetical protein